MPDPDSLDTLRRKLLFRSHHRGTREMDEMLGDFAARHMADLTPDQLSRFEALLAVPDSELTDWVMGNAPIPAHHDTDIARMWVQSQRLRLHGKE